MRKVYHAVQQDAIQLSLFSKVCIACIKDKDLDAFAPGRNHCKECRAKERKLRKAYPKPVPRPGYKFCSVCHQERPLELFPKGAAQCKPCLNDITRKRRQTPAYKKRLHERQRKQGDLLKAQRSTYYLENKEAYREREQAWRNANPERARARSLRRKARKLGTLVEKVDYKAILERYGYHCYICNKPIDPTAKSKSSRGLTFDHVIPLQPRPGEPQGTHSEDNIKPAHHACNVRKSNIPLELLTPWQRRGV